MSGQPDFGTAPRPSRAPLWDRVALVAGGLALLASGAAAWRARDEAGTARVRLAEVHRDVETASRRLRDLEGRARAGTPLLPAADAPPARIVSTLASLLPGHARLDGLSIDYGRGGVLQLNVVAREAAAWDLFLDRLAREPRFREVEPGPESRDAEVRSPVRAVWVGGAP
ncbi:MAG TPA: hypothetical protein VMT70_19885 [Vicinamibacteria bacterium]|nr:hypothetical protein [Vicinamibacteria bacterium]